MFAEGATDANECESVSWYFQDSFFQVHYQRFHPEFLSEVISGFDETLHEKVFDSPFQIQLRHWG
jgi:hypothetical protein